MVLQLTSDHFTGSRATRGGKERSGKKTGRVRAIRQIRVAGWLSSFLVFSSSSPALSSTRSAPLKNESVYQSVFSVISPPEAVA